MLPPSLRVEPRDGRLWLGLRATPTRDEIEAAADAVHAHLAAHPTKKVALHIEDVSERTDVTPLDLPCILCLVTRLLEHKDLVERTLRGACIQARRVDPPARAAHALFLTVYALSTPLVLVEGPEEAARFLDGLA